MAKTLEKKYCIVVKFGYSEYKPRTTEIKDITENDLNVKVLREKIIDRIEKACSISQGVLNATPEIVIES